MKIFGIGTDIVNIKRIDKSLKKYGSHFKNRIWIIQHRGSLRQKTCESPEEFGMPNSDRGKNSKLSKFMVEKK